ncbi:FG-GAP-like repeat-containing protein [Micromonospora avicenniae]|uniref:FlgD Ig-like domain-containing protein n=1 Tax=Micromonospora avicenniae TaxID=1198245 RepID=A0A1N7F623_9ACTN|nr:FG-GAP-like repeat-containing protein [Micromonospora avicenniae]SIR95827.1 FlgD Ig-like domain-containing protein [Micromonospora avicenniae]
MGRSLSAGALATTLALGLLVTPAAPAAAEPGAAAREIAVFPESEATVPAHEAIIFAGVTGFLHLHNTSGEYLWTRYDTGETVPVPSLAGVKPSSLKPAGGDFVSTRFQVPAKPAPGKVSVLDLSDQSWQQWAVPTGSNGYAVLSVYGRTVMAVKLSGGVGSRAELLTFAEDGTIAGSTPITVPDGAVPTGIYPAATADLTSAVVGYANENGTLRSGLLDIASGQIMPIPGAPQVGWGAAVFRLTSDTVGWASSSMTGGGTYWLYSRSGLADGSNTEARKLTVPYDTVRRSAIVGDGLVTSRDASGWGATWEPAVAVSADGTRTTLLPRVDAEETAVVQAADGTALVVGGSGARDWAVRRISAQPGQAPTSTPLMPVRDPVENAGLLYHQGLVRHVQSEIVGTTGEPGYALYNHPIVDDGSVKAGGVAFAKPQVPCETGVQCVRLAEGNQEGVAYVSPGADGAKDTLYTFREFPSSYSTYSLPTQNGRVVDVGNRYVLVDDGATTDQYLVDNAHGSTTRLGPATGAALWFDTLYRTSGSSGWIQARDLMNSSPVSWNFSTGAPCAPTELQASARWLYWSCGVAGPAGVYDLQRNHNLSVPAGPAMLGDGFLVRHETGALYLTDFHDGTVRAPVKLADLAAGVPADGRRVTWAVDRHGSGVAYVDAENAVHVLDTGVPGTPVKAATSSVRDVAHPRTAGAGWYGSFGLTRSVTQWELTVTRKWTEEVVHRQTGAAARQSISVSWDGKLSSGEPALNGPYQWTLKATTADSSEPVTIGTKALLVGCGTFPFRGYDCYGGPGLLGVQATGEGHWYGTRRDQSVPGVLYDHGYTDNWCLSCSGASRTSALVPFGDFNGDVYPDLLVRDGDGGMKAHLGIGQLNFGGRQTVSLGAGWMMYKSILAPGDVNSDGHDDILGVDADGKLWLYTTTGKGGINSRVQVGSGWNIYSRVLGAGDLNGDGHGDLLGVDATGVMYAYFSNGDKGWSSRVKVFAGWNIYNSIVAIGDLDEDGRNDLVARDADGVLWSYAGLGNGSFEPRVKAGSGWNMYKIII